MEISNLFLEIAARKLRQLTGRIVECANRLDDDEIWARGHDPENAIGNLMLHLSGNLRQWIVSSVGGAQDVRERDREFSERGGLTKEALVTHLTSTVDEAVQVIERLPPERLQTNMSPQGYSVTVLEGIFHVVEHFAQHTGQIIYATKMLTGTDLGFYRHLSRPAAHDEKTP